MRRADITIIGGGAAGALAVLHLARSAQANGSTCSIELVERSERDLGEGLGFSTRDQGHLLNVRAEQMSAYPDRPDDFVAWWATQGRVLDPHGFVPRAMFATYLSAQVQDALASSTVDFTQTRAEATSIARSNGSLIVSTTQGDIQTKDVVLATGNPPSEGLPGVLSEDARQSEHFIGDPWIPGQLDRVAETDRVVLVGTGLTMVDVVTTLVGKFPNITMLAVSRHGLLPAVHTETHSVLAVDSETMEQRHERFPGLSPWQHFELGKEQAASSTDWRSVFDGLRPYTVDIWRRLTPQQQQDFLDRDFRQWEVHRHRMPPESWSLIEKVLGNEQLLVMAGNLTSVTEHDHSWVAHIEPTRPETSIQRPEFTQRFSTLIDCTGRHPDAGLSTNPILRSLHDQGVVRGHATGWGIDVAPDGIVLDARGQRIEWLHSLGSLRRGEAWESTAIPAIRQQAATLANALTASD